MDKLRAMSDAFLSEYSSKGITIWIDDVKWLVSWNEQREPPKELDFPDHPYFDEKTHPNVRDARLQELIHKKQKGELRREIFSIGEWKAHQKCVRKRKLNRANRRKGRV